MLELNKKYLLRSRDWLELRSQLNQVLHQLNKENHPITINTSPLAQSTQMCNRYKNNKEQIFISFSMRKHRKYYSSNVHKK